MNCPRPPSRLVTLARLAAETFRPASNRVIEVLDFLAVFGVGGVGLTWKSWQATLIVFLIVLLALVGYAAYRLQRHADERSSPRFSIDALPLERRARPARKPDPQ